MSPADRVDSGGGYSAAELIELSSISFKNVISGMMEARFDGVRREVKGVADDVKGLRGDMQSMALQVNELTIYGQQTKERLEKLEAAPPPTGPFVSGPTKWTPTLVIKLTVAFLGAGGMGACIKTIVEALVK
ncbi:MAG: hypothetical protein KKB59_18340 [Spirochaetes bacterium]|nr:hypothetical protein [Spirochaetota bacterium]